MWTLIDSPLSLALLEARLDSGWLKDRSARIGSARYGFISARISSFWLSSGLCSGLGLVRLSSGSRLGSCVAGLKCWSIDESLFRATYPHGQSVRSQNVVFDTFSMGSPWNTIFSTIVDQSRLNFFNQPWARDSARFGSEHGSVRLWIVVRLDSELVSQLETRASDRFGL